MKTKKAKKKQPIKHAVVPQALVNIPGQLSKIFDKKKPKK